MDYFSSLTQICWETSLCSRCIEMTFHVKPHITYEKSMLWLKLLVAKLYLTIRKTLFLGPKLPLWGLHASIFKVPENTCSQQTHWKPPFIVVCMAVLQKKYYNGDLRSEPEVSCRLWDKPRVSPFLCAFPRTKTTRKDIFLNSHWNSVLSLHSAL